MPKHSKKTQDIPAFTPEELEAMTPSQKLSRIRYFEEEIQTTKQNLKDQRAAAKDYLDEMEAKRSALIDSIPQDQIDTILPPEGDEEAE